ncbi:MAG: STAS domain-containing protein [Collinsella sp.]
MTFIDSTGLAFLLSRARALYGREGLLSLVNASSDVARFLQIARLIDILHVSTVERPAIPVMQHPMLPPLWSKSHHPARCRAPRRIPPSRGRAPRARFRAHARGAVRCGFSRRGKRFSNAYATMRLRRRGRLCRGVCASPDRVIVEGYEGLRLRL